MFDYIELLFLVAILFPISTLLLNLLKKKKKETTTKTVTTHELAKKLLSAQWLVPLSVEPRQRESLLYKTIFLQLPFAEEQQHARLLQVNLSLISRSQSFLAG